MLANAAEIFLAIVCPLLLVASVGYAARRAGAIDIRTLVQLNLYIFAPCYLLSRLSQAELDLSQVGKIGLAATAPVLIGALLLGILLRGLRWERSVVAGVVVGSLFYNSANFGVPLAELAFGPPGGQLQAVVVMFTSLMMFFIGYGIVAWGNGPGLAALGRFFRLPYLYVVIAAVLLQWMDWELPPALRRTLDMLAQGMVPMALMTLGAQMGRGLGMPSWRLLGIVLIIKLCLEPLAMLAIVHGLGIWPWPGKLLVLSAAAPTAVNTLLISIDLGGDEELAAACVFWTTIGSAFSVAIWLSVLGVDPGL